MVCEVYSIKLLEKKSHATNSFNYQETEGPKRYFESLW